MNLGTIFTRHARYRADHLAVVFGDQRLTWSELNKRINRLCNALMGLGVQRGDKIATILPNCLELLEVYWAAAKTGAVVVPMSTMLMPNAMKSLLEDSDSVVLFTTSAFVQDVDSIRAELSRIKTNGFILTDRSGVPGYDNYEHLTSGAADTEPEGIELSDSDQFNIMYSSGTTGMPKGIVHTHSIRVMYGACFASSFRITPESVTMHAGAIVFNGAFVDLMPTIFQGATYVLLKEFEPVSYIETVHREKVTHVILVPAQIVAILDAPNFSPEKLASLEMGHQGGDPGQFRGFGTGCPFPPDSIPRWDIRHRKWKPLIISSYPCLSCSSGCSFQATRCLSVSQGPRSSLRSWHPSLPIWG